MELLNVTKRFFITGTDTEVGKTVSSVAILQSARLMGFTTAGYKPVASGSKMTEEGLRNTDALALQRNSSISLSYDLVNPFAFCEPTSPHIASANEKISISLTILSSRLRILEKKANWIVIEGAGGWFTPLRDTVTFADWVILEKIPVILVIAIKLGCINFALLTSFAIQQSNLPLVGWIANNIIQPGKRHSEYIESLKKMIPASFLGEIPWIDNQDKLESLSNYLDLRYLIYR